jgi:hypothetical protein
MAKEARTYAERQATGFPLMSITMPPAAHAKLDELVARWRLPKSTVIWKLILAADPLDPPEDT